VNLFVIAAVTGYVLGSLPFGWLVARARGVNIFEVGSKSSGATNVRRMVGPGAGYTVVALDAFKGAVASGWPILAWHTEALGVVGLVCAVIGHSFSCFTRFRGGKGVATAAGGFLVLMPTVILIALIVWTVVLYSTRYVSFASIVAAAATPVAAYLVGESPLITIVALVVGGVVIVRHRSNIVRLRHGTENKIGRK